MSQEVEVQEESAVDPKLAEAVEQNKPYPGTETFWDYERGQYKDGDSGIGKAYALMRAKMSKGEHLESKDEPSEPAETEETQAPEQPDDSDTTAEQVVDAAGLDIDELRKTYEETGELPQDAKEKILEQLKPLGVGEEGLSLYLEAQKNQASQNTQAIYDIVGGEEAYRERLDWAAQNLSPDEVQAFNAVVDAEKPDLAQIKLAVHGLEARYKEANGNPPTGQVAGRRAVSSAVKPFASQEEATHAVRNPEYRNNPAYRAEVEARLAETVKRRQS